MPYVHQDADGELAAMSTPRYRRLRNAKLVLHNGSYDLDVWNPATRPRQLRSPSMRTSPSISPSRGLLEENLDNLWQI
jgi:hypothetical protein